MRSRLYRDGPLTYRPRPPEEIRYGIGKCALGALLVASSPKGIVAVVVRKNAVQLRPELKVSFPKAKLIQEKAISLARVAAFIAKPAGKFPLPLDMRGTALQQADAFVEQVRRITARLPASVSYQPGAIL